MGMVRKIRKLDIARDARARGEEQALAILLERHASTLPLISQHELDRLRVVDRLFKFEKYPLR
jgi:hypothetical protein